MCAGDDALAEVAVNHVVSFCGDDVCTESWRAPLAGPERDAAALAWAASIELEYRQQSWTVGPASSPKNWMAVMRTPDRAISLVLGSEYVLLTVEPLPFCEMDRLMKALHPYLLAVASTVDKDWPAIAETEAAGKGIDAAVIANAAAVIGQEPSGDVAQRLLLASEPFACFKQNHRAKGTMDVVRQAVEQWEVWRNPSAKELRLREQEDRKLAKQQKERRDLVGHEVDDVPDETVTDQ